MRVLESIPQPRECLQLRYTAHDNHVNEVDDMKNVTLSTDEGLLEAARRRAAVEGTTLDVLFGGGWGSMWSMDGRLIRRWRRYASCGRALAPVGAGSRGMR